MTSGSEAIRTRPAVALNAVAVNAVALSPEEREERGIAGAGAHE